MAHMDGCREEFGHKGMRFGGGCFRKQKERLNLLVALFARNLGGGSNLEQAIDRTRNEQKKPRITSTHAAGHGESDPPGKKPLTDALSYYTVPVRG